jgi:intracellular septation protein A
LFEQSVGFRTWTYKFRFSLADGQEGKVHVQAGVKGFESHLWIDGVKASQEYTPIRLSNLEEDLAKPHWLEARTEAGEVLRIEVGYLTAIKLGIRVFLGGALIYESHPGKTLDYLARQGAQLAAQDAQLHDDPDYQTGMVELKKLGGQKEKFKRNWPSLAVDIGLGFVFFFVAKYTDLTTAAIWGAIAGLALVVVQQFVKKVDLLGGLALFGIVMMMISAAYAFLLQDEYLIQMRTTVMGVLGATLYLADGLILKGRYLGERTARYMFMPDIVPQRLSLALGAMSLLMAILNWGVVRLVSKDIWLYYTTFGDFFIAVLLFSLAIKWVTVSGYDAAQSGVNE